MTAAYVIGIDPGITGAMVVLDVRRAPVVVRVLDMPTVAAGKTSAGKNRSEIDLATLANEIVLHASDGPAHAIVERVSARPGEGVSSAFNFGRSVGGVLGVLAALQIPVTRVTPVEWHRAMRVPKGADKDAVRARAIELMPDAAGYLARKKDHGRADALLLALWGLERGGKS